MLKKACVILTALMLFALVLAGCQSKNMAETRGNEKFQEYYDARVQYLGDNSKVSELLDIIGAGELGEYTIALKTDEEPYGLTVNYSKLKNEDYAAKFENTGRIDYAYYALALIENLSEVDVNYMDHNYRLTLAEANEIVKGDIKDYGRTAEKLKELDQILNPAD
jgi:hypothetical protein